MCVRCENQYIVLLVHVGTTPQPETVTTRILPFVVGNPCKPSFVTVSGWGVDLKYMITQYLSD